jgi:lysophospholipase L1-like esterase
VSARRGAVLLSIAVLATVGGLFLAELGLFLLGDPPRLHEQVANPPRFAMDVDNLEFRYHWESNGLGLRYRELPLRRTRGVRRVFVVGDSVTAGEGVETRDRFTELLEASAESDPAGAREWINGGLGGQGVLQYARLFHWVGTRYRPDALLICVNANDLADVDPRGGPARVYDVAIEPHDGPARAFHALWPRVWGRWYRTRTGLAPTVPDSWDLELFDPAEVERIARAQRIPEDRIREWRARLPEDWLEEAAQGRIYAYLLSWGLLRPDFYTLAHDVTGPDAERRWSVMRELLGELASDARGRGVAVAMTFLPGPYLFDASLYRDGARAPFHTLGGTVRPEWCRETTEIQRRLRDLAADLEVPFLDLTEAFRAHSAAGEQLVFPIDGHWNPAGHRLAAQEIAAWLRERNPFDW